MKKNNNWRPTATIDAMRLRAELLKKIRNFFTQRNVLEVDTPLMSHGTITDPNIFSFTTKYLGTKTETLYLQTSPEFAMKRLLAAGSGSIYQICKAFRNEESGKLHNPEFTILEWYRLDFDHHNLMQEMDEFLQYTASAKSAEKMSYTEAFKKYLNIDPIDSSVQELSKCAAQNGLNAIKDLEHDGWLNILMSTFIEPHLGQEQPTFVYDYPASQAALARISKTNPKVAERFEVYIKGVELANGFHELANSTEQRQRFLNDLEKRKKLNIPTVAIDENFLAALASDFPNCAGVALGIDRLLMIIANANNIDDVIAFPVERA
jgi:lysyl-tRNA synthetase class 2